MAEQHQTRASSKDRDKSLECSDFLGVTPSMESFMEEHQQEDQSGGEQEIHCNIAAASVCKRERVLQCQLEEIEVEVEALSIQGRSSSTVNGKERGCRRSRGGACRCLGCWTPVTWHSQGREAVEAFLSGGPSGPPQATWFAGFSVF